MSITFSILSADQQVPTVGRSQAFLLTDNWDDWFEFNTQYVLIIFDDCGRRHLIGEVKVGQFRMKKEQRRPNIPEEFESLGEEFFSLGQDDSYYENLNNLGEVNRNIILLALRDVALDRELFIRALDEKVTKVSLLRSVPKSTVNSQFARLARGGVRLSKYEFSYSPSKKNRNIDSFELSFFVRPESTPPSNIHVLIGRNGVGKTHLLNNMAHSLYEEDPNYEFFGKFSREFNDETDDLFASLVSVTFSAFDPFEPLPDRHNRSDGLPCSYIGLKRFNSESKEKKYPPKSPEELSDEFSLSVGICTQGARLARWRKALQMLETDPVFRAADVASLAEDNQLTANEQKDKALSLFRKLSSGHKIVLLTITRLVEAVEERTLVLLDEPEAHLHPPLLSAFIRALSELLFNRNGVAIIATHSPVILQEVPKSCVWKIRREGEKIIAERPEIETFGENVGVLTREVFGLEVTDSGFHQILREVIKDESSESEPNEIFERVISRFGSQLGGEARALVRVLAAEIERKNDKTAIS
jgi:conserved hypothetical protein